MMSREHVLVDGDWLEQRLGQAGIVAVEVDEDSGAYAVDHIPTAIALDWRAELRHPLRRDVIDRAGFEALLSAKGIANDDTVVLYGGNNNWFAAYAYWYFKLYGHADVRLLDGGRKRWELDGRPLVADPVARPATRYAAAPADLSIRAFRDEVVSAIGRQNILDVRSPAEFDGTLLAPAAFPQEQPQVPGHVPTAVNVPWSKAAAEDGTFLPDERLQSLYGDAGVELGERDTIVYCRIGERSAHTWFVLHELLDQPYVKNYDGSWVEYGSLVGVPIEK
jgi:thiosulfate/3-mercaptopyruvate sulfurtransferase